MLFSALASGCTTDGTTSNVSLATSTATGPTIAFESIAGPPPGVFNKLVDDLSAEAMSRNLAIASREGAANYRVRGYLAAQVIRGRTHVSWVWDVYDGGAKVRTLRITGEETGGRAGGDRMERRGRSDAAENRAHQHGSARRLSEQSRQRRRRPQPQSPRRRRTKRQSRAGRAPPQGPTAAERLAMSAAR